MPKRLAALLGLLCVVLLMSSLVFAGAANTKKGKVFFKNQCRVCHDGTTKAPTLTPMTKTIAQWKKSLAKTGPACVARVKEKTGAALTDQDVADISAYLIMHAADSDQPATCGN